MGNASGLKCLQVLANAERALAIELLAGAQAVEFLAPLEPGAGVRAAHAFVRSLSLTVIEDRQLAGDIETIARAVASRRARCRRRGRGRGAGMTATAAIDARVEELCGDLTCGARAARDEADARSLADGGAVADAAQQPRPRGRRGPANLVVYGGTGSAARSHERLRAIVRRSLELGDDETLCVQSGKPVAVFRTHEDAPRVLIANSHLVPAWATWDEFRAPRGRGAHDVRPDDRGLVDLHRHAGDPPGHVRDVRRGRRHALRRRTSPGGSS